jgi:dihydroorotate dehydrogenase (NAD+) catalytic subunit
VRDICRAVDVPVLAVGGVASGRDAVEMILVGATAVGIGSAVASRGIEVFEEVCGEVEDYMQRHSISNLEEMRGKALAFF